MKFADHLVEKVLQGTKTSTMRLYDDKNLQSGDALELVHKDTSKVFAHAVITRVYNKLLQDVTDEDFEGNERFASEEEMYSVCRKYYGDKVGPNSPVTFVHFTLQ